jgi:hypothetical protein
MSTKINQQFAPAKHKNPKAEHVLSHYHLQQKNTAQPHGYAVFLVEATEIEGVTPFLNTFILKEFKTVPPTMPQANFSFILYIIYRIIHLISYGLSVTSCATPFIS